MNVVNTRTNILCIHGCHTRTNHKKMLVVTHVSHTLETFTVKKTLSIKAIVHIPKFLKKIHARLHEDMQQVQLGSMLRIRNVTFSSTLFSPIPHISSSHQPFIIPFPYIYVGFTLLFPLYSF